MYALSKTLPVKAAIRRWRLAVGCSTGLSPDKDRLSGAQRPGAGRA